jgi:hypothetical protein
MDTLTSSNPSVIAVVERRFIKAIAPGSATVTARAKGLTGAVSLTVNP